jgi:hypothetical protein
MLFKFKSTATADLIMLEADGRRLLRIVLGDAPVKGIVQWADMPAAIQALEVAVQADEEMRRRWAERQASGTQGADDAATAPEPVRLGQRALPMIKMLQRCQREQADMYWGV